MIIKINPDFSSLSADIRALPERFDNEGISLHDGRNQVRAMRWDGQDVVVKRYKKPNFFLKLQFTFLNTCKAKKAYKYGCIFNREGFSSPTPVAYIIDGRWPLFRGSFFICLPVTGTCLNDTLSAADDGMIARLASEIARMHAAGIMHGDLNLTNIYVDKDGEFRFIDTNRTKIKRNPGQNACAENLMRLTPDRALLSKIARAYARVRGWDEERFAAKVISRLEAFQRKKAILKKLKSICLKRK